MKRIYLRQHIKANGARAFIVTKLVGSVEYTIGAQLSHNLVVDLCAQTGTWRVEITGAKS